MAELLVMPIMFGTIFLVSRWVTGMTSCRLQCQVASYRRHGVDRDTFGLCLAYR